MKYIVYSGPEGQETTYEGSFATRDEAMPVIEKLEDNGSFCKLFNIGNLEYTTAGGPLPDQVIQPGDAIVTLEPHGDPLWIKVIGPDGTKIVRIGIDVPTGGCKVQTFNDDEFDYGPPNSEIVEFFA